MEYKQIVAITGLPGLFQLINTKNNGAIVKSLIEKNVSFISARKHQLTPLESIEIYTTDENIPLSEIFMKINDFDKEVTKVNEQNDKIAYKKLFQSILPHYDEDRVYASDIKKVFKWYQLLKENDLLNFEVSEESTNSTSDEATQTSPEKPSSENDNPE